MERFNVNNKGWMAKILDDFEETTSAAQKGFNQDIEQPHIRLYKSPGIEPIILSFGNFSITDEGNCIENRFELMEYIQKLIKSEITSPGLELIAAFEYREYQGKNLEKKPIKSMIISAEWQQK